MSGFKEYGRSGAQQVSIHKRLLFLPASSVSLRAGRVLTLSPAPPPPPQAVFLGLLGSRKFFLGLPQVLSFLPGPRWEGGGHGGESPLRKVGEGAAGRSSFRPSLGPAGRGSGPGPRASACARLWALSGLRERRAPTAGRTGCLAAGLTDGAAQGAGTRRDSDMAGHTQQPSGRGNPGPAPSPSPGPGPGPGASERVALKKEIGLVSACTIIIGERARGGRMPGAVGPKARSGSEQGAPLSGRAYRSETVEHG